MTGPVDRYLSELGRALPRATLLRRRVLVLLAFPVLAYPVYESNLPPAPWPAEAMPGHLAWKRDAVIVLLLVALGAALAALPSLGRLLAPLAVAVGALGAASVLGAVLTVEWADAVPGTPTWLLAVPAAQLVLAAAAIALLARALALARAV